MQMVCKSFFHSNNELSTLCMNKTTKMKIIFYVPKWSETGQCVHYVMGTQYTNR